MSLIEFSIDKMENGVKVHVFSHELTDKVIYKDWIVTDVDDACNRLEAIIDQIRQMEKTGTIFDEKLLTGKLK